MKRYRFVLKKGFFAFVIVSLVLFYGMYAFWDDFVFFFRSPDSVIDLGEAENVKKEMVKKLKKGDFVKIKGIVSVQGGRFKKGFWEEEYALYYFAGCPYFIVLQKIDEKKPAGGTYVTIKGRAYPFKNSAEAERQRLFFEKNFAIDFDKDGALIVAGKEPRRDYGAVFTEMLFLLLFLGNVYIFVRSNREEEEEFFDE